MWRPIKGTKEEKLRKIRPRGDFPSEREFEDHAYRASLVWPNYRPDLYATLCDRKWHHWNAKVGRWSQIRDWRKYVVALDDKIKNGFRRP